MSSATAPDLVTTRLALHALAERVISPVRQRATGGRIALQARPGGFGTQDLPTGGWTGVFGTEVVEVARNGATRRTPITSLRGAAEFVGDPAADALPDEQLQLDRSSARRLAATFDGATWALERLRDAAGEEEEPSGIDLWPEHFDIAITVGEERLGRRATYGVSPGDEHHPEPYAYVTPWTPDPAGSGWNATAFSGAEARYTGAAQALAFFLERRAALRK